MSPDDLKAAMRILGLSSRGLAEALRMGANGDVSVRRWMSGAVPVSGPASVAIDLLVARAKAVDSRHSPDGSSC